MTITLMITWAEPAEADLDEIFDYIARDAPVYAERLIDRIISAVDRLNDYPQIGRPVPEAERADVREIIYQGYRIIYLTLPQQIHILAVLHGSRDLTSDSSKPWEIG